MSNQAEVSTAVDKLGRAFEEFKSANDDRLEEIEKKGQADSLTEEKVNKINEEVGNLSTSLNEIKSSQDELSLKMQRPLNDNMSPEQSEHKQAFINFIKKGKEDGLTELEAKALNVTTDADGGFAVPEELDRNIERLAVEISPMRSVANIVQVGSSNYKKLVNTGGATSGWVAEAAARTETNTPQFSEVVPPLGEIYANPAATQTMLDDAFFDVESFLAEEIGTEFAQEEGAAFITGNGTNKPQGILSYTTAATVDGVRAFGTLQHIATGVAGGWAASNPSDHLIDVIHSMKASYRQGASWMMNSLVLSAIRKFKDADGNYIWRPGLEAGQPSSLLGYSVVEAEDMPDVAADALAVAFGNFRRGYTITDRMGTRVLRDPYSNKPYIHFYSTKRVGGAVVNSEAIKLLKFSLA